MQSVAILVKMRSWTCTRSHNPYTITDYLGLSNICRLLACTFCRGFQQHPVFCACYVQTKHPILGCCIISMSTSIVHSSCFETFNCAALWKQAICKSLQSCSVHSRLHNTTCTANFVGRAVSGQQLPRAMDALTACPKLFLCTNLKTLLHY